MPAGCHPVSESVALPVTRSGFCRLCFLHRLLLSLSDGLPAGWPKSSTPPKAALHNKGGSNAAHGFDEGLVTPTERIRAGQVGFEPQWERELNVKLEGKKKNQCVKGRRRCPEFTYSAIFHRPLVPDFMPSCVTATVLYCINDNLQVGSFQPTRGTFRSTTVVT